MKQVKCIECGKELLEYNKIRLFNRTAALLSGEEQEVCLRVVCECGLTNEIKKSDLFTYRIN